MSIDFCKVPEDLFSGSRFCILQLIVNKTSIKSIGGNFLWDTINFATQTGIILEKDILLCVYVVWLIRHYFSIAFILS